MRGPGVVRCHTHGCQYEPPTMAETERSLLGRVPASEVQDYALEVAAYTSGRGHLCLEFAGYAACHDAERVIETTAYGPGRSAQHARLGLFALHGASCCGKWYDLPAAAPVEIDPRHLPSWRRQAPSFRPHVTMGQPLCHMLLIITQYKLVPLLPGFCQSEEGGFR